MPVKTALALVAIVLLLVAAYLSPGARDRIVLLAIALLAAATF